MEMRLVMRLFAVSLVGALAGCGSSGDGCDYESTFAAIQSQIFEAKGCTSPVCHGNASDPTGGLDLRAGFAFDSLMRVQSTTGPMQRVFPGDHDLSQLYVMLAAKTRGTALPEGFVGRPMPLDPQPALTEEELGVLEAWIRGGAAADTIVKGTEEVLGCGGALVADPNKIQPLEPPAAETGVQFYSGAWSLPAESEDEVCFVSYYDFSDAIPDAAKIDCPKGWDESIDCFAYGKNELAQDAQSHHSIIDVYRSSIDPRSPEWGAWTCLGGANDGDACDPTDKGACGERSQCTTRVETAVACVGYPHAPSDFATLGVGGEADAGNRSALSGAQEPALIDQPPPGVYAVLPVRGFVSWNSHAFNLTTKDTTVEQWVNLDFVKSDVAPGQLFKQEELFEDEWIFAMTSVAPFTKSEVCLTFTLPRYSRLMSLSSHMHQRGELFRIWLPPHQPCVGGGLFWPPTNCTPPDAEPDYVSHVYNDAVYLRYDEPLQYDEEGQASRTFKACAVYDNGADDPFEVKRNSTAPNTPVCDDPFSVSLGIAGCGCEPQDRFCFGGPNQGSACNGDDSVCGPEGTCDACPLNGGITTDDEMFIPLGTYYVQPE